MVDTQLVPRGISSLGVLDAMERVPRERFVDAGNVREAYGDHPIPIGSGQTVSQPYIVAAMTEALELGHDDRVLEIGTGSGYAAAVLGEIAAEVWTVERIEELAGAAAGRLAELGYDHVHVVVGDGSTGWPEEAPYDAIVVTAAGPAVPATLRGQLVDGGRLVMPVGERSGGQRLVRLRRDGETFLSETLTGVAFVPLIGVEGWPSDR